MDNLLELVETCQKAVYEDNRIDDRFGKVIELEELGFTELAKKYESEILRDDKLKRVSGYIEIKPDDIKAFLQRKVKKYNKEHKKPETTTKGRVWAGFRGGSVS